MSNTKNVGRKLESSKNATELIEMIETVSPDADVIIISSNVVTGNFTIMYESEEGDITAGEELGPGTFVLIGWKGNISDLDYETVRYK